ncbi:MAG: DUF4115 domain-containing protein, partial [Sinobacterium sp.]
VKLSTQDIADKMKLKKALIEDIERDHFDVDISLIFLRGYLKLYAKHVHVEAAEVLSAFENLGIQKREPAKLQSFSRKVTNQSNDDKLMLVTYLILAAIITLVVIYWFQQSSTDTTVIDAFEYPEAVNKDTISQELLPLEEVLTLDIPTLSSPQINENESKGDASVTEELVAKTKSIDLENVNDPSNFAIQTEATETTVIETAAPVKLIFEFSGDCWLNLTDATGEKIAYGVKVKGRVMPVTGIPPFVVTLGAPEVVKIRYAGESIDMSFLPSGRIANFNLPLSE